MASFQYTAFDQAGKQQTGTINANSQDEATNQLRTKGLYPTQVIQGSGSGAAPAAAPGAPGAKPKKKLKKRGGSVKPAKLTVFTRQLATLIDASLPLHRALTVLGSQEKNGALKGAITNMAEAVQGGAPFSDALGQYPKTFDKLYVNMAKAGEAGGVLEVVLTRLAEYMEKAEKLKNKIQSAMTYPIVVLVITLLVLTVLMVFIVPQFSTMFADMGIELPAFSQAVFGLSNFMMETPAFIPEPLVLPNAAFIVGGLFLASVLYGVWTSTPAGRSMHDSTMLRIPVIGTLQRRTVVARFARTLGTLVQSGVPILQALQITKDTAGNVMLSNAIAKIYNSVREGEAVAVPMRATNMFPDMVTSMVEVGEEIGQLPDMLMKVADVYEEEVDNSVASLTSIIEPVMIVVLAGIVGSVVFAVFLPMFKIIESI